jgi:hypothetical protein
MECSHRQLTTHKKVKMPATKKSREQQKKAAPTVAKPPAGPKVLSAKVKKALADQPAMAMDKPGGKYPMLLLFV